MKLSILSRLILSYLAILILMTAMSAYSIVQMDRFNAITRSLLAVDTEAMTYADMIRDNLLSQIRYEKKYLIARETALYSQFLLFKGDGDRNLKQLTSLTSGTSLAGFVQRAREQYLRYHDLFAWETGFLDTGQIYDKNWYSREKAYAVDETLAELEKMRSFAQRDMYKKIGMLRQTSENAGKLALVMLGVFIILGIITTVYINRSITRPIAVLKRKTHDIARGNFDVDLHLDSPPELAELAGSFNLMCYRLNDLDRMKGDFFASMSHELRTPLASLKEGISLLRENPEEAGSERSKKILAILAEESERLISLVNTMLDLSKMEVGMMEYHYAPASIPVLIDKASREITPLLEAKGIILAEDIAETLPLVRVDAERMLQVLRNLLGNAVKFTPEGGVVTVSARLNPGGIEVAVTDTGPGIPPESLAEVFNKYRQVAPGTGSPYLKGTGLGLAIARQIVSSHGGKIWVENEPERGSKFIFLLPVS
jgi:two-component system, NtrC family, sensor histidine kinase GlrK